MYEPITYGGSVTAFLLTLTVAFAAQAGASALVEAPGFAEVAACVDSLTAVYGPEGVLLVFDIDNTLLACDQPLGTPQWFDWQDSLITADSDSPFRSCDDFQDLLAVQGMILTLGRMHLTEPDISELVGRWQAGGHRCLVLSSREPWFNDATQRDLSRAGFDFGAAQPDVDPSFRGVHMPYSSDSMQLAGLTGVEISGFDLGTPREVRYEEGVMMVAGQHKGAMLLILLAHITERFPAVVFVDDNHENVRRVFDALDGRGIDIIAIRYGAMDSTVAGFGDEERLETLGHLTELDEVLEMVFDTR